MGARCTHREGSFLRRRKCDRPASGQCVYCAATFCDAHGEHGIDHHEICTRSTCRAKYRDLFEHRDWVKKHHHDNLAGYCAADDCDSTADVGCEGCHLRFCIPHVRPKSVSEMKLDRTVTVSRMLCPHCSERRRLWD